MPVSAEPLEYLLITALRFKNACTTFALTVSHVKNSLKPSRLLYGRCGGVPVKIKCTRKLTDPDFRVRELSKLRPGFWSELSSNVVGYAQTITRDILVISRKPYTNASVSCPEQCSFVLNSRVIRKLFVSNAFRRARIYDADRLATRRPWRTIITHIRIRFDGAEWSGVQNFARLQTNRLWTHVFKHGQQESAKQVVTDTGSRGGKSVCE